MSVAGTPWDPQGLQTVGIILLFCSSLKLLHALGIIDLARGGGTGTGMGLQWDGDVVLEVLLASCSGGCRMPVGGVEGLVCSGTFVGALGCGRLSTVSGGIRVFWSWGSEGVGGLGCEGVWEFWGAWRGTRVQGYYGFCGGNIWGHWDMGCRMLES